MGWLPRGCRRRRGTLAPAGRVWPRTGERWYSGARRAATHKSQRKPRGPVLHRGDDRLAHHRFARTERLAVIARAAVFPFKGQAIDPQKAGQKRGARRLLDGSVQRSCDRARVNVRLVDVATGYNVWAEAFDDSLKDVFVLQNNISGRIVEALELKRSPAGVPRRTRTPDHQRAGVRCLPTGTVQFHKPVEGSGERAIDISSVGRKADPHFALGDAALGSAYTQYFLTRMLTGAGNRRRFSRSKRRWRWTRTLLRAIWRARSSPGACRTAFHTSVPFVISSERSRSSRASPMPIIELGKIYLHIGLLDKAIAENTQALRLDPGKSLARAVVWRCRTLYLRDCAGRAGSRRDESDPCSESCGWPWHVWAGLTKPCSCPTVLTRTGGCQARLGPPPRPEGRPQGRPGDHRARSTYRGKRRWTIRPPSFAVQHRRDLRVAR